MRRSTLLVAGAFIAAFAVPGPTGDAIAYIKEWAAAHPRSV